MWDMSSTGGTYTVAMGDRGRLVIPAELRARNGLETGVPLILLETPGGMIVMTREQARDHLSRQLARTDVVAELLSERRAAAAAEDAG